ncbi:hypothetical protein UFOVP410_110 [uncultured Caudovirales phage]|uniref:Uncharacterized protein n=1 Tax=uncultured Caudovirales phage TaxID=2100421 RepID=A0A6J5M569_9CAUD|nr:hypothetical protein UFOVP410_110 [uncultured Caudovirales phage]
MSKYLDFLNSVAPSVTDVAQYLKTVIETASRSSSSRDIPGALKETIQEIKNLKPTEGSYFFQDGQALSFPSDLFSPGNEAYVLFFMREPTIATPKVLKRIAMYMPPSIKVNYGAKWENINMTLLQSTPEGQRLFDNLRSKTLADNFNSEALSDLASSALAGLLPSNAIRAVDEFTTGLNAPILAATGMALNPHAALKFESIDFRNFEFTFNLLARNAEESDTIRKIIKTFKWGMHPAAMTTNVPSIPIVGGNSPIPNFNIPGVGQIANISTPPLESGKIFWQYPNVFDIYLFTPSMNYMFNIKRCVLENIDVNYTGSDRATFFRETGAPVHIDLTLRFKEMSVLTKDEVEKDY